MSTPHDTNERRSAIWPWILMPLVVLLVAYTLHDFHKMAESAAQARTHVTMGSDDGTGP